MKKLMNVLVLMLMISGTAWAQAPTAEKVVADYIKAIGGEAKWKAVKSMKMNITMSTQGIDIPGEMNATADGKQHLQFNFSGLSMIQAYDGTTAWKIDGFSGQTAPVKMEGAEAEAMSDEEFLDEFIDYKKNGATIAYLGEEEYEGLPYHKISKKNKDGKEAEFLFDQETGLLLLKRENEGGQVVETQFQDYQKLEGLISPMKVIAKSGGRVLQSFVINKIEFDVEMPDKLFAFPGN